jgi:hypothetical protein
LTTRGKPAIGGITGTAVAYGTVDLDTTQVGDLYLIGNCVGCVEIQEPVTIVAGEDREFAFEFVLVA